jgi:hypothetical protein
MNPPESPKKRGFLEDSACENAEISIGGSVATLGSGLVLHPMSLTSGTTSLTRSHRSLYPIKDQLLKLSFASTPIVRFCQASTGRDRSASADRFLKSLGTDIGIGVIPLELKVSENGCH